MSKAEDRALEKYPQKIEWVGNQWNGAPFDVNSESRAAYKQGYNQAEKDLHKSIYKAGILDGFEDAVEGQYEKGYEQAKKDLELGWEDISMLNCLLNEVEHEFKKGMYEDKTYKGYCQEVLKRFKERK